LAVGAAVAVLVFAGWPRPVRAAQPWLFVNDVHFDPFSQKKRAVTHGSDTNEALLVALLGEMKRLAPDPPVIVMAGDFLAHTVRPGTAEPTMIALAKRFGAAFPHSQFLMALGNEDSDCGDYAIAPDSNFLRVVTNAWAPLVDRNGAAPDFRRTFPHDGFYTAKLPIPGVRAVVADNAYWSTFYRNPCGKAGENPTSGSLTELDRALHPATPGERLWLVMHIPPGIDASSTAHRTHHLVVVPFMRPGPREAVMNFISDPARHVELVVTAHIHRFSFRVIERQNAAPVPLLISPAVSPIFGNSASFLTADVGADGVIRNLEEHSYVSRRWQDIGGLGTLDTSAFTGAALADLQHRLERDTKLRDKYEALYMGDSPYQEIDPGAWRTYYCAISTFSSTTFRECVDEGGFSFITSRGIAALAAAVAAVAAVITGIVVLVVRARRARTAGRIA
jgi:hypothetical protein